MTARLTTFGRVDSDSEDERIYDEDIVTRAPLDEIQTPLENDTEDSESSPTSHNHPEPRRAGDDIQPPTFPYLHKRDPNNVTRQLQWTSHHNQLGINTPRLVIGDAFKPEHELWTFLEEGDVIAVYACALYPGWQNTAKSGKLLFWERFDPMGLETTSNETP